MRIILIFLFLLLFHIVLHAEDEPRFTWKNFGFETVDFTTAAFNPVNNNIYALGHGGGKSFLFVSSDNGQTWVARNEFPKNTISFSNVSIKIDSRGNIFVIAEWAEMLLRSMDDGCTYDTVFTSPYSRDIIDYKINSKNEVFIISHRNKIFRSQNSGNTWDTIETDFSIKNFYINSKDEIYLLSKSTKNYEYSGLYDKKLITSYNK